jgi:hypothetical protein
MKLSITILAALALITFNRVSVAKEPSPDLVMRVADQVVAKPLVWASTRRRHVLVHYRWNSWYPAACEAVIFPRSPVCAGRPASFGPYAPYPWNAYVYY